MSESTVLSLQVRTITDPLFNTVARLVNPPALNPTETTFLPAYAGFDVADGSEVDISYFYAPPADPRQPTPRQRFDRHLRTEELWVVAEGDFLLPLSACRVPEDAEDPPRPEDFLCFAINEGDMFVIKPNVWHCGPWPMRQGLPVRFFMMLAGHRKPSPGSGEGDYVDFYQREFSTNIGIVPAIAGQPML